MSDIAPIAMIWQGDSFTPASTAAQRAADKHYCIGERYNMAPIFERTPESHRRFFAALHDIWLNLDHRESERFINETQFRKHCLIRTGYCSRWEFACSSRAEAERLCIALSKDDVYAIVVIEGKSVVKLTAKSQAMNSMDKKTFNASAQAVLDYGHAMIGISATETRAASAANTNTQASPVVPELPRDPP